MILSVRYVRNPKKLHWCWNCRHAIFREHFYFFIDCDMYPKPIPARYHVSCIDFDTSQCGKYGKFIDDVVSGVIK